MKFLDFSSYQDSDAASKQLIFSLQYSTGLQVLIETLREEIKPVITQKIVFKNRIKLKMVASLGTFW